MNNHFIALVPEALPDNNELKILLGKMKRTLKDKHKTVRWMPPDLWHITIQFLGPLGDEGLTQVYAALNTWRPEVAALELKIQGVGAFPDPMDARVLWLGVQYSQELKALQRGLAAHLVAQGVRLPEERPFVPHLTIARLRNLQSVTDLVNLGGRKSFGVYPVGEAILFKSVLQNAMAKYVPLHRKNL